MDQLFEQFLKEKRYLDNVSENTIIFYRDSFKAYKRILNGQSDSLTKQTLKDFVIYLQQVNLAISSINCWIRGVNSFLSWLHENEHIPKRLRSSSYRRKRNQKPLIQSQP